MVDAHTHLHDPRIAPVLLDALGRARDAGITEWVVCGTSPADWTAVEVLAGLAPSTGFRLRPAFGVHPWYADALPPDWLDRLEELLRRHADATVGEVGLDALRQGPDSAAQRRVLDAQLALAARLGRAVSLHAVRCVPAVLEAVRPHASRLPGFVVHSFAGSTETLSELVELGGYASFGGTLLNPAARRVHAAAAAVPPDRVLVETDAPDMRPVGGEECVPGTQTSHPANLVRVVAGLAARRGLDPATAADVTAANARRLFGV